MLAKHVFFTHKFQFLKFAAIPIFIWLCWAQNTFAAGFEGPGALEEIKTAAAALEARDDAPCVLEGHILSRLPARKNRYLFEDSTGRIVVEIKKKVFGELTVTPETNVRLEGEVDWDSKHPNEVEVDFLTILNHS